MRSRGESPRASDKRLKSRSDGERDSWGSLELIPVRPSPRPRPRRPREGKPSRDARRKGSRSLPLRYKVRRLAAALLLLLVVVGILALGLVAGESGEQVVKREAAPARTPDKAREAREEPPPSEIASPGFYPAFYEISAEYTENPRAISGTQNVRYVNAEGRPLESLRFNLWTNEETFSEYGGGTEVSGVSVNGRKARYSVEGTGLQVKLPSSLPAGQSAEIELDFETKIPEMSAPFGHESGVSALGVWHPVLAVHDENGWNRNPATDFGEPYFAEAADYRVELTLPEHLTSVATGVEQDRSVSGEKKTITYEAGAVRDFALAVSGRFDRLSRNVGGTTVNVYHLPGSKRRAESVLDLASKSLVRFSKLYGAYPYREFDVVDASLLTLSGTEYSSFAFTTLSDAPGSLLKNMTPHQVAHQWWNTLVGSNQFEEPWLDESLATYSEWLFTRDAATRFKKPVKPAAPLDSSVSAFPTNIAYQQTANVYGAQLYRELSRRIGEKTLERGLRIYVLQNRHGIATPEDLVRALSAAAGKDLSPFFASRGVSPDGESE